MASPYDAALAHALEAEIAHLLPAHDSLCVRADAFPDEPGFADRARGDYIYVQGRGDRLHALLVCVDGVDASVLDAFAQCDANWRWIVAPASATALVRDAVARGCGVFVAEANTLAKQHDARPNPGTFIKAYPALRKRWRTIASW